MGGALGMLLAILVWFLFSKRFPAIPKQATTPQIRVNPKGSFYIMTRPVLQLLVITFKLLEVNLARICVTGAEVPQGARFAS